MNSFKTLIAASLLGTAAFAAPGLTVSGTDLQYNGKKIFFSGTNLAWSDYNSDVGSSPLDENAWRKAVEGTRAAGGNAIRWWLFNNMSQSPTIDESTHLVTGPKENTIANMKKALDIIGHCRRIRRDGLDVPFQPQLDGTEPVGTLQRKAGHYR